MGQSVMPSLPVVSSVPALPRSLVEALSREAGLLQILTQNLPDLVYVKDAQCRYVFNSASHLKFLGVERQEELLGKTVLDLLPGELAEKFYRDEEAIIQSGRPLVDEEEETQDYLGRRTWVSTTKVPLHDEAGTPIGLIGISRDISDRRRAEEERRRVSAELAAQHAELEAALARLKQTNEELASAQVQLAEVAKMHSVGALAAGIVHEVKNPLAALSMGLDYLENAPAADGVALDSVMRSMREALDNANAVVRGLLDHCRPGRLERAAISLNVPIERALLLVRYQMLKRRVTTCVELHPELPPINADRTPIEQVLINVLTNALHASPEGGRIMVRTGVHEWDGGPSARFAEGERVVSAVVDDDGPGIPAADLGQVYKPFFTTKPAGEGTGLGLTVARSIVELHGGVIRITNRPEGGVRVTLTFKSAAEGVASHA
jgi:PAS domain S-box-containing protein